MPIPSGVDKKKSKVYIEKGVGTENYIQILPESFCEEEFIADSFWPVSSHFLKQYTDTVEERIAPFKGATATVAGKIGTVPQAEIGDRNSFLRGDGKWTKINITDEKVKFNLNRTKRYYLSGTDVADANTGQATFDTGVFVTENPGELQATKFLGNLKGNVEGNLNGLADRALKDADGHVFTDYYVTNSTLTANCAPLNHKHPSSDVNALTNYAKGNSTAAISAGDTLNQALGKLEKRADGAATLNSPAFTGTPTVPNIGSGSLDSQIANKKYVDDKVSSLINGAGAALDTLSELANALGNDANFATTVTNKFSTKLDKNSANYVKSITISDNTTGTGQILKMQRGDDTVYTLNIKDTVIQPATAAPKAPAATAAAGTSLKYAREDHVHPFQNTTVANATNAVAAQHADRLTTPRNLRANLAATEAAPFDGSVNQLNIPVAGILPVANGGTGAANLNGLVQTGNVNQTIGGTKTFSSTISGSINGNAATATTATKVQGTPSGTSWVAGAQEGKALVTSTAAGYGTLLNAPTKDYRVALGTYPSNDNLVYLYSITNANVSAGTNTKAKQATWNADTGELTATSFKGNLTGTATACSGNAASATKATQDGDGKVISSTYLKLTGGVVTGTLDLTRTTDAQGTGTNAPALRIGVLTGAHLEFDGNEIMAKATESTTGTLYINSDGGLVQIGSGGLKVTGMITGNLTGNVTGNCSGSSGSCTGNAATATKLAAARNINGTSFDGSAAITTANWGTARNISISDSDGTNTGTAVSVNGSGNATLKLPATIKASITGNCSGSSGSCTGNAASATKATNDSANQQINTTYIKGLSVSGKTITYTKGDGSTGTITTQDTNTTYSNFVKSGSNAAAGLVPKPSTTAGTTKYLREDCTWQVPPNTTYSNFVKSGSNAAAGLVPKPSTTAGTTKYLREDCTWQVPPNTTYSNFGKSGSEAAAGLVPKPSTTAGTTKYLREDCTWQVPPNTTYSAATQSAAGLMSAADKKKLDGVASAANAYTHPTGEGNNHVPSGGSSGQFLGWSSAGAAKWVDSPSSTYSNFTYATASAAGKAGLVPAPPKWATLSYYNAYDNHMEFTCRHILTSVGWMGWLSAGDGYAFHSSDKRLKQDFSKCSDSLLDAWEDVNWCQFKFKKEVEEHDGNEQIHTGLVVQDLHDVFEKHNISCGKYHLTARLSGEAIEAMYDDEGNLVCEAQPAVDEWRLNYSQAFAIEAAYQRRRASRAEARIAELEDRLSKLEAVLLK